MVDTGGSSKEYLPKRELPAWTTNEVLIKSNPELHHYTDRRGLQGIWNTNSLWATHYSNLSDSSEIVLLKNPLAAALAALLQPLIMKRQQEGSWEILDYVNKQGGVEAAAHDFASRSIEDGYKLAFTGGEVSPSLFAGGMISQFAEPFICSFCSHANDDLYERENGLLSQWRGYGGNCQNGRYALVFDTRRLDNLLAREWRAHYWVTLDIEKVVYFEGFETLEREFPELSPTAMELMSRTIYKRSLSADKFLKLFLGAATLLKHRGFREEREVRIVACSFSERAFADRGIKNQLLGWPPIKEVRGETDSKKYVALFESLSVTLPIKRIIVGPSSNQEKDFEFAQSVVSAQIPIVRSETPFIG
jgi:hypothetical protein